MVAPDVEIQFLSAPFLVDLDSAARRSVLELLEEHTAKAGDLLLKQGELNDRIFFLIEGTIAIERTPRDGKSEWVLNLTAPNCFGETSFFQRKPQIVTVRGVTALRYLTLDRHAYEMLRRADPRTSEQIAQAAIRVLAEHFDLIDQRVAEILSRQPDPGPEETEWNRFRARLFSESML